ncbi:hypothetical protein FC21_GL000862 [Limosilactobacillus equigenerosi DSM 18793 = JCM 14505]|uniref:Ferritin/DPS domain-containing protein n=2 Tax=Limosilactobacillus TaxID=2742598 RepID=A0A0R1UUE6_9LACO|nr:hypothetical protein FC21_GL000862 [Limosilactobacillus equigenerosi DSM 18793 = JCM 14505]
MMNNTATKQILNQLIVDTTQLSMIVHQTHWYMRGTDFLTLHPLMDEWRDDLEDQVDELAERLIVLDGAPTATLAEVVAQTKLTTQPGVYTRTMTDRLDELATDYRYLADLYQQGIEITGDAKDDSTQDILIGFKTAIEKLLWMIESELSRAPKRG